MDQTTLIIVGGGIAGSAAALRAAQNNMPTIWIVGDKVTRRRSRGQWVENIGNVANVNPDIVLEKVRKQLRAKKFTKARDEIDDHMHIGTSDIIAATRRRLEKHYANVITIIDAAAETAALDEGIFTVTAANSSCSAPYLVLATGVMDQQPSILKSKGEKLVDDIRWVYPFANRETVTFCIRCMGHLTVNTRAGVVGSGETAARVAMMLHERYESGCIILTNGEKPRYSEKTTTILEAYGITTHQERITDLTGKKGKLRQVSLQGGTAIEVDFLLVALGYHRIYNDLARQLGAALEGGRKPEDQQHVLIDHRGLTNIPEFFAVGDVATRADEPVMKQVYTAQEYAVRAVDSIDNRRRKRQREKILSSQT